MVLPTEIQQRQKLPRNVAELAHCYSQALFLCIERIYCTICRHYGYFIGFLCVCKCAASVAIFSHFTRLLLSLLQSVFGICCQSINYMNG